MRFAESGAADKQQIVAAPEGIGKIAADIKHRLHLFTVGSAVVFQRKVFKRLHEQRLSQTAALVAIA